MYVYLSIYIAYSLARFLFFLLYCSTLVLMPAKVTLF